MITIPVGVSNHHVHLTKEDINILFGENYVLTKKRDLSQKGEFATNETVTLENNGKLIEYVRIIGPYRPYTQVEILKTDAEYLGLCPPVRKSGDLNNSETITIIGPKGKVKKENSCIIAERHIHINSELARKLNLTNEQVVTLKTKDNQIMDKVFIKEGKNFNLELHIDKCDSKEFNLENGSIVYLDK